jgi:hypothetical protein
MSITPDYPINTGYAPDGEYCTRRLIVKLQADCTSTGKLGST